ncbi:MAG: DsbA family protein [Pseudomonadota bacterium]
MIHTDNTLRRGKFRTSIINICFTIFVSLVLAGCFEASETEDTSKKQTETNTASSNASSTSPSNLEGEGSLPEKILGNKDAPVTIIEYSSMTCPHCAAFHRNTLPDLKKKYIDTGKAKYILREFPLDDLATAAFMLARCVDPEKYFPFIEVLYQQQRTWARAQNPLDVLLSISKQAGVTEEKFNACLQDRTLENNIRKVREHGGAKYNVNSTPTFVVNGQILRGAESLATFERIMAPHIK